MKKRFLALTMALMMAFSAVPLSPLAELVSIYAVAGDTTELKKVYDSVPPKSEWGKYIDTKTLAAYYEMAEIILAGEYDQSRIDNCKNNLQSAIDALKLHTQGISFDKTSAEVAVGDTLQINAILTPNGAADPITWKSGDETIATVNQKGLVSVKKYLADGVTIIASSNNHTASCKIKILNPIAGIKLSDSTVELFEKRTKKLTAEVYGKDESVGTTDEYTFNWKSSNDAVATVTSDGELTGIKEGVCTVTVTATSRYGKTFTAVCDVKISKFVYITSIDPATILTENTLNVTEDEVRTFSVKISPANASIKELTWSSSNEQIVKISAGKINDDAASVDITALKEGMVKLSYSATDGSGVSGSINVVVKPKITSLKLKETVKVLTLDTKGAKILTEILPENAGNQVLDWTSDNTGVCAVDYDGVLYPAGVGTCVITAKTTDGSNITVKCRIRVTELAETIRIDKSEISLINGTTYVLKATVTTTGGNKHNDVIWTSSDEKIASVNENGKVSAYYPGKAVITATAADGSGISAQCNVTVTQPITGVSLPRTAKVSVGGTTTLQATLIPEYASETAVTWSSSDESVVKVDANGKLTGVKVGSAVVTCKTVEGGYTASCTVSVVVGVNGVTLNKKSLSLRSGEMVELVATVAPAGATNKRVTWTSSNPSVASVDAAGIVVAGAGGTCVITVTTEDGGYTAKCNVSVDQDVSGIEVINAPSSMYVGQRYQLKARVFPETATNQKVEWYTSDSSILLVDTAGFVVARKAGTAEIKVQSANGGHIASCIISVTNKVSVTGITLDTNEISLEKGGEYLVIAGLTPSNASEKTIQWTSSNLAVASVDENGLIKATGAGQAVITARTVDGGYTAKCKVIIVQPVTGVRFSDTEASIPLGKSKTLTASVIPTNSTNKSLMWFSSDSRVATVDQNGLVQGISSGTVDITATSVDGGYSAVCKVKVYVAVTGVTLSSTSLTVPKGENRIITATVKPADAENTDLIWSSSNEKVASVTASGKITGKSKGTATITVRTEDGGFADSCTVEVVQLVTAVKLDSTSISLDAGKSKTLTATVSPSTASDKGVNWKSSDTKVAKVNSNGKITAVSAGTAIITVTSKDGNSTTTCKVTVNQPATGISLNKSKRYVDVGSKYTLKATLKPANVTNKYVTWTSSNSKIASVSSSGVVTGIKTGTAVITAATANGEFKAKCTVIVIKPVTGVSLDKTSLTINVGKTSTLTPTVKPSSASIKDVTWSSSDNDVASVNSKGKITAKGPGYTTITVTTKDNSKMAECRVLVIQPVSSVKLNKTSGTLEVGDTYTLKATVKPGDASNKSVKWSTSNKKVATISSSGKITAVGKGTATITCKTVDGNKVATCKVNVIKSVTSIKISNSKATVYTGKTLKLNAKAYPKDATNTAIKWYTSDSKIAKVSQSGVVTPLKAGTVTITAKTVDGGFKKTCTVTVKVPVSSIKLSKTSATVNVGKTYTFKATVSPSNATDKTITWNSSDEKVVYINSNGKIKAVGKGTATITAKSANGVVASCKITVKQPVTSVKLSAEKITVYMGETAKFKASARPTNANDRTVTCKVANSKIISLKSGVITPLKLGTTTITATASNGVKSVCTVTVKRHVSSVKLNSTSVALMRGETFTLVPTIAPKDASEKGVTYKSSDESIATVSSKGVITAIKGGKVTITVTTKENNKTAKCTVEVREPVTGVTISRETATIFVGEKLTLKETVSPADAYNPKVKWYTSDNAVATIDQKGNVTAVGSGTVKITVKTYDGQFKAVCTITVNRKAEGVTLNKTSIVVNKGAAFNLIATVEPYDSYNKNVTWTSSDESVAVVNNGAVSGIKPGNAVITVVTEDGAFKAECKVRVNEPVTSLDVDKSEMTLHNGETGELKATVLPENADNKTVVWTSSDEKVAIVENGKVTGVSKGTAVITAKTEDGGFLDVCTVNVRQNVTEISTSMDVYSLHEGTTLKITASALPENAENLALTWKSSDESVVKVLDGEVQGIKIGEADVTISSVYTPGVSKTIKIKVTRAVAGITLSKTETSLLVGATETLKASIYPEDAASKDVVWSSSDEKVAVVKKGTITAIAKGEAVISVSTVDGGYTAQCKVNVIQPVTLIKFEKESYIMSKGVSEAIKFEVLPENANNKALKWSSSDANVLTVQDGVVMPINPGEAVVTATDSSGMVKAQANITVISKASGIVISKEALALHIGESETLTARVLPEDATNSSFTWKSENTKIATVKNGKVTAVAKGETRITVESTDGKFTASCKVTVLKKVEEIKLETAEYTLLEGAEEKVNATVLPADAESLELSWKSDNNAVVTVSDGVIKAVSKGVANITVQSVYTPEIKAVIKVTVTRAVSGVTISASEATIDAGSTIELKADVTPADANNLAVSWSSSDKNVATVNANGIVTAVGRGEAVITVKTKDGGFKAQCKVTVNQPVTSIVFGKTEYTLAVGEKQSITYTIVPENANNKTLTWLSSDDSVAVVENGEITAKKDGTATITATDASGKVKAEIKITVIVKATGIEISESSLSLKKGDTATLTAKLLPENVTDTAIQWSTGDKTVATVKNGVVTAVGKGSAVITVKTADGEFAATCLVTVTE